MTAILYYANYDNNYISINRTYCICQVTNPAYANTFAANLKSKCMVQEQMLWTIFKCYHSDGGHFVHKCGNHKGNG